MPANSQIATSAPIRQAPVPGAQGLKVRATEATDGAVLYELVVQTASLEPNSGYAYVMLADLFGDTCALAELDGRPAGCVIALRPPRRPEALFVWQIGVHPHAQRRGVARAMLDHLLARPAICGVSELLATVSPNNAASMHMFGAFARARGLELERIGGYPAELFPLPHEAEPLLRIAPL